MHSKTRAMLDDGLGASQFTASSPALLVILLGPFVLVALFSLLVPGGIVPQLFEGSLFFSLALSRAAAVGQRLAEAASARDAIEASRLESAAARTAAWAMLWTAGAFLALLT